MERVAGVLLQMGQVLQEHPQARRGRLLQGIFHIPELRPPHPDDIHHELDRAAAEGFPEGHEDARRDANVILLMVKITIDKNSYIRHTTENRF